MADARPSAATEAALLRSALRSLVPGTWDGKTCVLELRTAGSTNWRQMEWPGFYFEHRAGGLLVRAVGGRAPGPRYGTVQFDYERSYVWDFKAHTPDGRPGASDWVPTNDVNAVNACIAEHRGIGFLVASGAPTYSDEFRRWHQDLSGPTSAYRQRRAAMGETRSRRRKGSVKMSQVHGVFLADAAAVEKALAAGWLGLFNQGQNSNGMPRPVKYLINLARVPDWARV